MVHLLSTLRRATHSTVALAAAIMLGSQSLASVGPAQVHLEKDKASPIAASPQAHSEVCDPQIFYGVQHCTLAGGQAQTIIVNLNDPHVHVRTVLSRMPNGPECNSVNPNEPYKVEQGKINRDPNSNCGPYYPFERLQSMLQRNQSVGAVAIINTDYFGCPPCDVDWGDHGAQGLAVRNGVWLEGPDRGVDDRSIANQFPSLSFTPGNRATISRPGSDEVIRAGLGTTYYNTVAGDPLIVEQSSPADVNCHDVYDPRDCGRPQSAAGLDNQGNLILAASTYGASGLANMMIEAYRVHTAIKFDGGGSAGLAWVDSSGAIQHYHPEGGNRQVAEGLLIFSERIPFGDIGGVVKDRSGQLVPGATVTFSGGNGTLKTTTDSSGMYHFSSVPTGSATISATNGFFSGSVNGVVSPYQSKMLAPIELNIANQCIGASHRSEGHARPLSQDPCPPGPTPTSPAPTPAPVDGIEVVSISSPVVTPGSVVAPSVTIRLQSGTLGPSDTTGNHLHATPEDDSNTFGAWPVQLIKRTVRAGETYTFDVSNDAGFQMIAPNVEGTYVSVWQLRVGGNHIGPVIRIPIQVRNNPEPTPSDTTPPTTSVTLTGSTGNNGWYLSAVAVHLSALDNTGVARSFSQLDGGAVLEGADAVVTGDAAHSFCYWSVDVFGNRETAKCTTIKIDQTPPVTSGSATGPRDINGLFRDSVRIDLTAIDNVSGVDVTEYSSDGGANWMPLAGNPSQFTITGNGASRFLYRSVDVAGNLEIYRDSGPIIINRYVIFSNDSGTSLRVLRTTNTQITGDVHTNGGSEFSYNTATTVLGTVHTVGSNNVQNANTGTNLSFRTGEPTVSMLVYPLDFYRALSTVTFPSTLYLDSVSQNISGTIYVEGDVVISAVNLTGDVAFIADRDILARDTGTNLFSGDPHNGVVFYAGRNIDLQSTHTDLLGLLYAPQGRIALRGTGLTVRGSLVANEILLDSTTGVTVMYDSGFSSGTYGLPLTSMAFDEPDIELPALPGTPSFQKPRPAENISATGGVFWTAVERAVGYQLQIARSADFEPESIVLDISRLDNYHRVELAENTNYVARVRAINQSGYGEWSAAVEFTTNSVLPTSTRTSTSTPTATQTSSPTVTRTATRTSTPVAPTHTRTATPAPATATRTPTTVPASPTRTATSAVPPGGVQLLSSTLTHSMNGGAVERYVVIPGTALMGKTMLRVTYDLHGCTVLGGDASAIIFDQGGWRYISLANYGQNGYNGQQVVDIPLSAFPGLNPNASVGLLHTRFWHSGSCRVEIYGIVAYATTPTPTRTATQTPSPTVTRTATRTSTPVVSTVTRTATPAPATATRTATTVSASPTRTATPAVPPGGVQLLSSTLSHSLNGGAVERYVVIPGTALMGKTMLRVTYDLHGCTVLGGDASAIIFDQGGWRYISLANYGQNGYNGQQVVDIPLSAFPGLNPNASVGLLHTRFWNSGACLVDISGLLVY